LVQCCPYKRISKAGNDWSKQEFILETVEEQFSRNLFYFVWRQGSMLNGININDEVEVSFNIESREFNGRWFTNVNAWRINPAAHDGKAEPQATAGYGDFPPPPPPPEYISGSDGSSANDLPF
jgi:hypothetical protein